MMSLSMARGIDGRAVGGNLALPPKCGMAPHRVRRGAYSAQQPQLRQVQGEQLQPPRLQEQPALSAGAVFGVEVASMVMVIFLLRRVGESGSSLRTMVRSQA
jgi:hypothetical protein